MFALTRKVQQADQHFLEKVFFRVRLPPLASSAHTCGRRLCCNALTDHGATACVVLACWVVCWRQWRNWVRTRKLFWAVVTMARFIAKGAARFAIRRKKLSADRIKAFLYVRRSAAQLCQPAATRVVGVC